MPHDNSVPRRDFLKTAFVTAAGLASSSPCLSAARPPALLTLGFSTYGSKALTTEAAITLIDETGFDSLELTIWPDWDANPVTLGRNRRRAIRKRLADAGLRVTSLMEHLHIDE